MIDERIDVLEKDIKETQVLLDTIKSYVRRLASSYNGQGLAGNFTFPEIRHHVEDSTNILKSGKKVVSSGECSSTKAFADVNIATIVEQIPFDNIDGGVWKQGFDIAPKPDRWSSEKPLNVFVVPHSHTDPGWVKTYMSYYDQQTKNILDSMLAKLSEDNSRKFIYCELAFFAIWWADLNDGDRQKVRGFLSNGQLELVGGGWVMPDEAVTYYYGVLDQLQEGHSWYKRNLGIEVKSSWAIDPFGHSPTIAYLQKMAGIRGGILQRVHYSLKKKLSQDRNLEFHWRQQWDDTGETDFLTHMMPFYSYDVPHTCGPDPSVCCQFDFNRMPTVSKVRCPWRPQPVAITEGNKAERATMLADQYRKKAELFKTDALFIPLGDDFRWESLAEWDAQMKNYGILFGEINGNKNHNMKIQWATLADYFNHVMRRDRGDTPLNSLAGDFMTYADRDQHYWSGYYTSRPFQKRFSRIAENDQRSADILFSLALSECNRLKENSKKCDFPIAQLMQQLTGGRRNLAIFQHHDGITGTAKDFVVEDYGVRMLSAMKDFRYVQQVAASFLLLNDKAVFLSGENYNVLTPIDNYPTHDSLAELTVIRPYENSPRWVSVFNSLAWKRHTIVKVLVTTSNVSVVDEKTNKPVRSESFLHWTSTEQASADTYMVAFEVELEALSLGMFRIEAVKNVDSFHSFGQTTIYNAIGSDEQSLGPFTVKKLGIASQEQGFKSARATTSDIQADFNLQTGTLKSLSGHGWSMDMSVEFVSYTAKETKEKSGAYLFIPDEHDPHPVKFDKAPVIRISRGRLLTEVSSFLPMVEHRYSLMNLTNKDGSMKKTSETLMADIQITNIVDIRGVQSNFEIAMRINSPLKNGGAFFSDLNGFQMTKRIRYEKLSLQGNFYPVTSQIAIEDTKSSSFSQTGTRMTLLTAQVIKFNKFTYFYHCLYFFRALEVLVLRKEP